MKCISGLSRGENSSAEAAIVSSTGTGGARSDVVAGATRGVLHEQNAAGYSRTMSVQKTLLDRAGSTYAEDAGITLRDKPSPLWQLLVLSMLLSARISSGIAVRSTREISAAGWRTPEKLLDSTWQERVDALGRGGYRRFDEKTSTQLEQLARHLIDRWNGDLRRLRDEAGDARDAERLLQEFVGIGPAGASIFLREVQGIWPQMSPYADKLVIKGAEAVGLPADSKSLMSGIAVSDRPRIAAACVRVARDNQLAEQVSQVA